MELTPSGTKLLDVEDFRRLGVRPNECRLTVIRRAAARSAKSLAEQQLSTPTPQVELQLTRVATSTYRLLDPRKRQDVYQRAYIGRILPNALQWAGRTNFSNGNGNGANSSAKMETPFGASATGETELIEMLELSPASAADDLTRSLNVDDLIRSGSNRRRRQWVRRQLSRPATLLVLTSAMIGSAFWLANWSGQRNRLAVRRVDPVTADPSPSMSFVPVAEIPSAADHELQATAIELQPETSAVASDSLDMTPNIEPPSLDPAVNVSVADVAGREPRPVPPADVQETPLVPVEPDLSLQADAEKQTLPSVDGDAPLPMRDGPTLDAIAIREVNSMVTSVKDYFLDLFQTDGVVPTLDVESPDPDENAAMAAVADATAATPRSAELATERPIRFAVPGQRDLAAARKRFQPVLPRDFKRGEANATIRQIEGLIKNSGVGTAEHFAACSLLAEVAWTVQGPAEIQTRLQPLVVNYEIDIEPLLAGSYVGALELADLPEDQEHLIDNGLRLAERLLLAESFVDCEKVVTATRLSVDLLDDEQAMASLEQLAESVARMSRLSESMSGVVDAGAIRETASSEEIGIAGRYYCLMLRQWDHGLPWLVEASDPLIASHARKELGIDTSEDDLSEIADLWLSAAKRSSGRAADSMRLHAIDLLQRAGEEASSIKKNEIQRSIDEIEESVPPFLLDPVIDAAISSAEPLAVTPPVVLTSLPSPKTGFVGRVRSHGQDVGAQLMYESGVSMTDVVIEQIRELLDVELEEFEIEFEGTVKLNEPTTVRVVFAPTAGVVQQILIGETSLDVDHSTASLAAGEHKIRWTIEAAVLSSVFLRVQDAESNREIEVAQPETPVVQPLPTRLSMRIVRSSQ